MSQAVQHEPHRPTLGSTPAGEEVGVIVIEGRSSTPLGPKILAANEAMAKLSGFKVSSLSGSPLGLVYDRKDLRHLVGKLGAIALEPNPCFMDRVLLRNGETKRLCRWTIRPTNREKEVPGHFVLTVRPLPLPRSIPAGPPPVPANSVIPQTPAGDEAAIARKLASDYESSRSTSISLAAGGVAHDFKNALQSIRANLELAEVSASPGSGICGHLHEALLALGDAEMLARQMLAFSKGDTGPKRVFEIGLLLDRVARLCSAGSKIRCHLHLPGDVRRIEGDPVRIYQVLHNLVMNARQSMPGGGPVFLASGNADLSLGNRYEVPAGRYTVASIKDRGCGIEPAALSRIFEPDYTTKPGGNGFGLASCRDIVERHGGHIRVASIVGVGTEFLVFLPSTDAPADLVADFFPQPPQMPSRGEPIPNGTGRVLVVEDDPAVARSTRAQLKHLGYEAWHARDGREAIALFEEHLDSPEPFELVILDMTLPGGLNGPEVAAELRHLDPLIRIVATSGYFEGDQALIEGGHRFSAILAKPYGLVALGEMLESLVAG